MTPPSDSSVPGSPGLQPLLSGVHGVPRAEFFARPNSHPFQNRTLLFTGADQQIKVGRSVARSKPSPNNGIFDCKGSLVNISLEIIRQVLKLSFAIYHDILALQISQERIRWYPKICRRKNENHNWLLKIAYELAFLAIHLDCVKISNLFVIFFTVLSRNHALIWYENGKFYLQDTKSSNGTFVNNQRLSKGSEESVPREVCSGDILQVRVYQRFWLNLCQRIEMIIFGSPLTTFEMSSIFWGSWGKIVSRVKSNRQIKLSFS